MLQQEKPEDYVSRLGDHTVSVFLKLLRPCWIELAGYVEIDPELFVRRSTYLRGDYSKAELEWLRPVCRF